MRGDRIAEVPSADAAKFQLNATSIGTHPIGTNCEQHCSFREPTVPNDPMRCGLRARRADSALTTAFIVATPSAICLSTGVRRGR